MAAQDDSTVCYQVYYAEYAKSQHAEGCFVFGPKTPCIVALFFNKTVLWYCGDSIFILIKCKILNKVHLLMQSCLHASFSHWRLSSNLLGCLVQPKADEINTTKCVERWPKPTIQIQSQQCITNILH